MTTSTAYQNLLNQALEAGCEADVIIDCRERLSLKAQAGKIDEQSVSDTRIIGLRLIRHDRVGIAYSETDSTEDLQQLFNNALQNATFNKPDPLQRLIAAEGPLRTDDKQLCPESQVSVEDRISMILELEKRLTDKPRVRNVPHNGLSETLSSRHIYSTRGVDAASQSRMNSLYAYVLAEKGDVTAMAGHGQAARQAETFNMDTLIEDIYQPAIDLLEGQPVPGKHYSVIFDTGAQSDLFAAFSSLFSGKGAQDGVNPWRDKVSQAVAHQALTWVDTPLDSQGFGYALFDAEGHACAETTIVSEGRLVNLLHNSVTATYFKTQSTGHAQRGPRSALSAGPHQLSIEAGTTDNNQLTAGEYLLLTELDGLHSACNVLSGDFSLGASGYLCRDGQKVQPVRGITVAGNFMKLLHQIEAIGNKTQWNWTRQSHYPAIRFGDVAISG